MLDAQINVLESIIYANFYLNKMSRNIQPTLPKSSKFTHLGDASISTQGSNVIHAQNPTPC